MRYTLKDHGYPYKVICSNGKTVGRVYRHAETGMFHGKIGNVESPAQESEQGAFYEVAARAMGFASFAAYRAKKQVVQQADRVARHRASQLAREYMAAGSMEERFAVFDKLFGMK
jgi:hypothetical protein